MFLIFGYCSRIVWKFITNPKFLFLLEWIVGCVSNLINNCSMKHACALRKSTKRTLCSRIIELLSRVRGHRLSFELKCFFQTRMQWIQWSNAHSIWMKTKNCQMFFQFSLWLYFYVPGLIYLIEYGIIEFSAISLWIMQLGSSCQHYFFILRHFDYFFATKTSLCYFP